MGCLKYKEMYVMHTCPGRWKYMGVLLLLTALMSTTLLTSCSNEDDVVVPVTPADPDNPEAGYKGLKNPRQTAAGQKDNVVTWSTVTFGAYPSAEVVSGSFDAVDAYAISEGDIIHDAVLHEKLVQATWTDDETEIGGHRYRRVNGAGAVSASGSRSQHYRWKDTNEWHYFEYAPMKWRVLKVTNGGQALLLADRIPDVCVYNDVLADASWEQSHLRQWLNTTFLDRAFTSAEQSAIMVTAVENVPNYYFGTSSGPDTNDKVFVLSENEVFAGKNAVSYGFYPGDELNDYARRFTTTLYAKCRGAWWSSSEGKLGNAFWGTRTNGYTMANTTFVGDAGDIYNRGIVVTCDDIGVLPAINVDLSIAEWQASTDVVSTNINKEQGERHEAYYTGDAYRELQSPWVKDPLTFGHETLWSCLTFGSYPASEVVGSTFDAVDSYALNEGEVIQDASLLERLKAAIWTDDDDTEIDGQRYHRINGAGAVTAASDRANHYRWKDVNEYHYFAYQPIKWRVLKIRGSKATLLADRMPDSHPFHLTAEDTDWSRSDLRAWLNNEFLQRAFSEQERQAILDTENDNARNSYYGTSSGPFTTDQVFLLSANEIYASPLATDYGFYAGSGIDDPAKRFRSTLYAKCRGAWWSSVDSYRGNSFWMMRTSGYTNTNVAYVCDFGYLYVRGTSINCDDAALLPAVTIDLEKAQWQPAPAVHVVGKK